MEVKVEVISGTNSELLQMTIGTPQKSISNNIDYSLFTGDANDLIEKEGVLLYEINSKPNKKLLVNIDPIQRFDDNTSKVRGTSYHRLRWILPYSQQGFNNIL
ncbi:MAG: hypothetical protein U5J63_01970 [Fodinibius sp.]|nr:hypothetical protein [Fodinibius sp.]